MRRVIDEYGRSLVSPPPEWWDQVTVTPIRTGRSGELFIAAPLWTSEEGRSDLTLELILRDIANGAYEVQIQDLHVL